VITCGAAAPRSARESSGRFDRCNRLNVLYFPFSETTPSGKLQFHVFAALAEFERNLIRERTHAGLSAARARGRVGGRPAKLGDKQIREIRALMADPQCQVSELAKRYGVSRTTLYKRAGMLTRTQN